MEDRFLSIAGAGGNSARAMRQYWIKIAHPWVQKILSSTGAGIWRKAPMEFPDSNSVLDHVRSAIQGITYEMRKRST